MIAPLLDVLRSAGPTTSTLPDVEALVRRLAPMVPTLAVQGELPWGRYILHAEQSFNLQLDVFSPGYVGGIHAHDTWGIVMVLRGGLWVDDYDEKVQRTRFSWLGRGGVQGFCPPNSDWHRVSTPADGPQTVSFHVYGRGFDLDTGKGLGPDGVQRTYRRGPPGDHALALRALVAA